jgi:methylmalonyl-CoA mutase
MGGMASAIEAGIPKLRIEESATKTQARIDSKSQTVVGVNKYLSLEKDNIPILKVDNKKVREGQLKRLKRLKADRDMKTTQESLDALTKSAETGEGNLLELAINAARAKATVGEISYALEKVWGRYEASPTGVQNIYSNAFDPSCKSLNQSKARVKVFKELEGRSPRILIAKMGQDGHDRGQKVVATAFQDIGFDVIIGPLFQTPKEAAIMGIENDVDIIAASSLAAGHLNLIPSLKSELDAKGSKDIMIVVGGVIPPEDVSSLKDMGAKAVFPPGTNIPEAALEVLEIMNMRLSQGA